MIEACSVEFRNISDKSSELSRKIFESLKTDQQAKLILEFENVIFCFMKGNYPENLEANSIRSVESYTSPMDLFRKGSEDNSLFGDSLNKESMGLEKNFNNWFKITDKDPLLDLLN